MGVHRRLGSTGTLAGAGQQLGMAGAGHAVGQGTRPAQAGQPGPQAVGQGTEGAGHGRGIDDGQHRQPQAVCHLGSTGLAVVESHHPFHEDEVGLSCRVVQTPANIVLTGHPQIQVVNDVAAGQFMPGRIQEIRPGLEDAHVQPGTGQAPCQGSHHRSLAMAGGRRADQHRRRKTGGQLAAGRTGMGNSQ